MPTAKPVAPNKLTEVLDFVRNGGRVVVPSAWRMIVIDSKCLKKFEKAGEWLLKVEGDGYRMRQGKGSVYLLSGQLHYVIED